jgi:hypothetical protein
VLHCNRATIRANLTAVCLILLAAVLHYTDIGSLWGSGASLICVGTMIYVGLLLYWGVTLRNRLTNIRMRRLLFTSIGLMILWFVLRSAKYDFFSFSRGICRQLWYSYYIPLNFLPTLSLIAAWSIGYRKHEKWLWFLLIPDGLFTTLVLTNDMHHIIFGFTPDIPWENYYRQLPMFFVMTAWMALQYLTALAVIFHQCRISHNRRLVWLPVIWILCITIFFFWYNAFQFLSIRKPFEVTEAAGIALAAAWESCIQTGLIPSNIGYEEFLRASTVDAQIVDRDGRVRISAPGAESLTDANRLAARDVPVFLSPDIRLQSRAIRTGRVYWKDDLSTIHRLNQELREAKEALSEENDLIRGENKVREEQTHLREQNRIYDSIAAAARPQISKIRLLLQELTPDAADFSRRLGMACVLNAYLKRSSNLRLLSQREQSADSQELVFCLRESLDYISVCGVECSFIQSGRGTILLSKLSRAYAFFEESIEKVLPDLDALVVNLSVEGDNLTLRLMLDGPDEMPGAVETDGTFYRTFQTEERI